MFEILIDVTDSVAKPKPAASGSVRTTQSTPGAFELTSSRLRLFTFQRTRRFPVETSLATFVAFVVFPISWLPTGEANLIVVSTAVNGVLRIFSGLSKPR